MSAGELNDGTEKTAGLRRTNCLSYGLYRYVDMVASSLLYRSGFNADKIDRPNRTGTVPYGLPAVRTTTFLESFPFWMELLKSRILGLHHYTRDGVKVGNNSTVRYTTLASDSQSKTSRGMIASIGCRRNCLLGLPTEYKPSLVPLHDWECWRNDDQWVALRRGKEFYQRQRRLIKISGYVSCGNRFSKSNSGWVQCIIK